MKYYYAQFTKTQEAIEVEFPDLPACVTFGSTWDEAYENAVDVLAGWLAHSEPQFIKEPSSYQDLEHTEGQLVPVPVDDNIVESYKQFKRVNVVFPTRVLEKVDQFRKTQGLKRSTLLQKAVEEYLARHESS